MADMIPWKDRLARAQATAARAREMGKVVTGLVMTTAVAAAACGAIGAYDEAKGESREHDEGITTAYVGPIPVALAVAGVGKAAALSMGRDEDAKYASAIGQGALDAWSYVEGRRLWKRHAAAKK